MDGYILIDFKCFDVIFVSFVLLFPSVGVFRVILIPEAEESFHSVNC